MSSILSQDSVFLIYERQLIYAILHDNSILHRISRIISSRFFVDSNNAIIYEYILDIVLKRSSSVNYETFLNYIPSDKDYIKEHFIQQYRQQESEGVIFDIQYIDDIAKNISNRGIKATVNHDISKYINDIDIFNPNISSIDFINTLYSNISKAHQYALVDQSIVKVSGSMKSAIKEMLKPGNKKSQYITTGFNDLDKLIHGFRKGEFTIIAARPSMGKTAFICSSMYEIAKSKPNGIILFFSIEMSVESVASRFISMATGVDLSSINKMTSEDISNAKTSDVNSLESLYKNILNKDDNLFDYIYIDSNTQATVYDIRSTLNHLSHCSDKYMNGKKVVMIVIDYIQMIRSTSKNYENRSIELSYTSRELKSIAKDFDIPVVGLSQLSRDNEKRNNKRPMLSDLRDSGALEQDADVVISIYREYVYLKNQLNEDQQGGTVSQDLLERVELVKNGAEINVIKNRNGKIGSIQMHYQDTTTRFCNLNHPSIRRS